MKFLGNRILIAAVCLLFFISNLSAQGFSFNCSRDTTIPGCNPVCFTMKAVIPDLYGLSTSYSLNPSSTIPGCFPVYVQPDDPAGSPTNLTIDDRYSAPI